MAYKVKKGDTLSQIAKKKGVTLQALLTANPNIKNANQIRVGRALKCQRQVRPQAIRKARTRTHVCHKL